jgi:hypothetical protein
MSQGHSKGIPFLSESDLALSDGSLAQVPVRTGDLRTCASAKRRLKLPDQPATPDRYTHTRRRAATPSYQKDIPTPVISARTTNITNSVA